MTSTRDLYFKPHLTTRGVRSVRNCQAWHSKSALWSSMREVDGNDTSNITRCATRMDGTGRCCRSEGQSGANPTHKILHWTKWCLAPYSTKAREQVSDEKLNVEATRIARRSRGSANGPRKDCCPCPRRTGPGPRMSHAGSPRGAFFACHPFARFGSRAAFDRQQIRLSRYLAPISPDANKDSHTMLHARNAQSGVLAWIK